MERVIEVWGPMLSRCISCFCICVMCASCAVFQPEPVPVATRAEREALYELEQWSLDGRIAVRSRDDSGQASVEWNHRADIDSIRLSGPLGQGAVDIRMTSDGIQIKSSDGSVKQSDQPDTLLTTIFGVPIPVAALRYWVLGISFPAAQAVETVGSGGRLETLLQSGWKIEYQTYEKVGTLVLPVKLTASRGTNRIRLVVDDWQYPDADTPQIGVAK